MEVGDTTSAVSVVYLSTKSPGPRGGVESDGESDDCDGVPMDDMNDELSALPVVSAADKKHTKNSDDISDAHSVDGSPLGSSEDELSLTMDFAAAAATGNTSPISGIAVGRGLNDPAGRYSGDELPVFYAKKSAPTSKWCFDDARGSDASGASDQDLNLDDRKMPAVDEPPRDSPYIDFFSQSSGRTAEITAPSSSSSSLDSSQVREVRRSVRHRTKCDKDCSASAKCTKKHAGPCSKTASDISVGDHVWVRPEHCLPGENEHLNFATVVSIDDIDDEEGITVKYSVSETREDVSYDRIKRTLGKRKRRTAESRKLPVKDTTQSTSTSTHKRRNREDTKLETDADTIASLKGSRGKIKYELKGKAKAKKPLLATLHHAMEHSTLEQVKNIFYSARTKLLETLCDEDVLVITRGLVNDTYWRKSDNGDLFGFNLLHTWAYHRYNEKLLNNCDADDDAAGCLDFLLSEGADIRSKSSDSQTVLHIAMILGHVNVIRALVGRYEIHLSDLLPIDNFGETPLHGAISEGRIECLNALLEESGASDENVLDWIEKVKDDKGNNLLVPLIRYTDVKYECSPSYCRNKLKTSMTLKLFDNLLKRIVEYERFDLLLQRNNAGDNIACIVAKMGQIYEARAVFDICVPFTEKSIANRCGTVKGIDGELTYVSPLQWATETRDILAQSIGSSKRKKNRFQEELRSRGVSGLDIFYDHTDDTRLEHWLDSANKAVHFLANISKNQEIDISLVEKIRPGTAITHQQILSKEAKALKKEFGQKNRQKGCNSRLNCVHSLKYWKICVNKQSSRARNDIEAILNGRSNALNNYTEIRLIRDPCHPCVLDSDPCDIQVGLFAKKPIPPGAIICEVCCCSLIDEYVVRAIDSFSNCVFCLSSTSQYTGLIAREKDHYDSESPYTMNLNAIDRYFAERGASIYSESIVLDAAQHFNEGALVNDARGSPFGDDDENHKEENCSYVEVELDNWPHLFIGCHGCDKDEELTVDYGPEYWSKKATLVQKKVIKDQQVEIERLKDELANARKRMVFQEGQGE